MSELVIGSSVVYKRPNTKIFGRVFSIDEPFAYIKWISVTGEKQYNPDKLLLIKLVDLTQVDIRKAKVRLKAKKEAKIKEKIKANAVPIKAQGILPLDPKNGSKHWVEGWQYDADTDKWWPESQERL